MAYRLEMFTAIIGQVILPRSSSPLQDDDLTRSGSLSVLSNFAANSRTHLLGPLDELHLLMMSAPILLAWGISPQEMFFIFMVILLLFGAKKLPELARGLGSSIKEFKKAKDDFDKELHTAQNDFTIKNAPGKEPHRVPNRDAEASQHTS